MAKKALKGWAFNPSTNKYEFIVYNSAGAEKAVFNEDGALFNEGVKVTASAALLNASVANLAVTDVDGSEGNKAVAVNGLTMIAGGTGIADLTLAAPTPGAVATVKLDSLASGSVVVTCATGVTLDGTNDIATFDAAGETLVLYYKAADEWAIAQNVGSVALSATAG
jgi:hypothetical protein